jgi:hypothetical protein
MGTVALARSLDCRRNSHAPTSLNEGANVLEPRALVEVHREEPTRLIREERVDAHHVLAREVADHCCVVAWEERLIRAVAALDLGQFAHTPDELVSARRGVSAFPCPLTHESSREDVLTPAKPRTEQSHLVGGCVGNQRLKSKRQTYLDFRCPVERSQLCSKGGEAMPRLRLLGFERGETSLRLHDGIAQCIAGRPLSSVVLHERMSSPAEGSA